MICKCSRVLSLVNRCLTWITRTESWPLNQFPDLTQFAEPNPIELRRSKVHLREDPGTTSKIYTINFSLSFPPKGPKATYQGDCAMEKGNKSELLVISRHCPWTDTTSGRPTTSLWSTSRSKNIWKSGHQWSFSSHPKPILCLFPQF